MWCTGLLIFFSLSVTAVLYMEPDWDFADFLNAASQRLEMASTAKRVFNADGKFLTILTNWSGYSLTSLVLFH